MNPKRSEMATDPLRDARTYLFVPGNRPERFAKALASGADAIVIDLEDAVVLANKAAARDAVARWAADAAPLDHGRVVVRINQEASPDFADDLRMLRESGLFSVMCPKVESAATLRSLRERLPQARVLALMETARGVADADAVAAAPGVTRLVFGTLDFALDLDLDITERADGLSFAASRLAIASRVAGLPSPVAGVTPQIDDGDRLLADLAWARWHGAGAKLCIHPRQVAPIHEALAPTAQAVDWARRVVAADAASPGAARLDGRMIDRPVVVQALRTLQRHGG
jgi:citrate lyase subunit beta/citryl-CoA lyase